MSDNDANQPPLDTQLPDDLAECESVLARMSLPQSRVQRDELLYRAGWAAAEVQASSESLRDTGRRISSRAAGRHTTLAWSFVSAAIAASLAVAVTLRVQTAADAPANSIADVSRSQESQIDSEQTPPQESLADVATGGPRSEAGVRWTASLLIMRDRELLQQLDDRWAIGAGSFDEASGDNETFSEPQTSREMLQEFLPGPSAQDTTDRDSARRQLRWLWKNTRLGGTT